MLLTCIYRYSFVQQTAVNGVWGFSCLVAFKHAGMTVHNMLQLANCPKGRPTVLEIGSQNTAVGQPVCFFGRYGLATTHRLQTTDRQTETAWCHKRDRYYGRLKLYKHHEEILHQYYFNSDWCIRYRASHCRYLGIRTYWLRPSKTAAG